MSLHQFDLDFWLHQWYYYVTIYMYIMTAQDIHCVNDKPKHYQANQMTKDKGRHHQRDSWLL